MADDFYSKGTIKIKNADGIVEPFLPTTDFSCVDDANGKALTQTISEISTKIEAAENSGGIELMYDEPTSDSTADFSNETIIAWIDEPDVWQYVVDTTVHTNENGHGVPENTTTAIPFNLYGMPNITLTVDWGDGNTSTLTSADYTNTNSTASKHTYSTKGIYTIRIKSNDWSNTYFSTFKYHSWSWNQTYVIDKLDFLIFFRGTLIRIDSPIPGINGVKCWEDVEDNRTTRNNSLKYLFYGCEELKSIPSTLFHNCSNIVDFEYCFGACQTLQSIPKLLFESNSNATNFKGCFYANYAITSIPEELFKHNTAATNFSTCFDYSNKIASIPENLFRYNTNAMIFDECFASIPIKSIPENLFRYNTNALSFKKCFYSAAIKSIPENLFKYNTNATDFSRCFDSSWSLLSIPENLFRYNTNVADFSYCFSSCRYVVSIPENLFRYNTNVADFSGCFFLCNDLTSIPEDLFRYNTNATNVSHCFMSCESLNDFTLHIGSSSIASCTTFATAKSSSTRTIYVPSGSTTESTFNAVASDLGLTIIGE